MKTIRNLFKQDKEKFVPPKGVQDCIPIKTIYKDGIFETSKNKFSKCFRLTMQLHLDQIRKQCFWTIQNY